MFSYFVWFADLRARSSEHVGFKKSDNEAARAATHSFGKNAHLFRCWSPGLPCCDAQHPGEAPHAPPMKSSETAARQVRAGIGRIIPPARHASPSKLWLRSYRVSVRIFWAQKFSWCASIRRASRC